MVPPRRAPANLQPGRRSTLARYPHDVQSHYPCHSLFFLGGMPTETRPSLIVKEANPITLPGKMDLDALSHGCVHHRVKHGFPWGDAVEVGVICSRCESAGRVLGRLKGTGDRVIIFFSVFSASLLQGRDDAVGLQFNGKTIPWPGVAGFA